MDEIKKIIEELQKAFAEFKAKHNEELAQIKAKGSADPLLTEQVKKLNDEISRLSELKTRLESLETKAGRIQGLSGQEDSDAQKKAYKEAFLKGFIRKGSGVGLQELFQKAYNVTTPADGGYAVPTELSRQILQLALNENLMRQICSVVTVGTPEYKELVDVGGTTGEWIGGETGTHSATATPTLSQLTPYWGEMSALPAITNWALEDMFFDVEAYLSQKVARAFADLEEAAFVSGNGTNKPKGILAYTVDANVDGTRAFGTIQRVNTGNNSGFRALNTSTHVNGPDDLYDLIGALKATHRTGSIFLAPKLTYASLRKIKDANEQYIWQPSIQAGQPATLLGYPARECEAMPAMAQDAYIMAFGNFARAYKIFDRAFGMQMLRDPYTLASTGYVRFPTRQRVGGMLVDSEAIKLLKQAA